MSDPDEFSIEIPIISITKDNETTTINITFPNFLFKNIDNDDIYNEINIKSIMDREISGRFTKRKRGRGQKKLKRTIKPKKKHSKKKGKK